MKSVVIGVVAGVSILIIAYGMNRMVPLGASAAKSTTSVKASANRTP